MPVASRAYDGAMDRKRTPASWSTRVLLVIGLLPILFVVQALVFPRPAR